MTDLFIMAFEFFKTGLFAVGGGLATIPFLYHIAEKYGWLDINMLPNMIAVSESTPGPIGVNMATYVGFQSHGIIGAIVTTLSLVFPSVVIIILISKILDKFKSNHFVQDAFYGLRPAVTALIASAGVTVLKSALFNEGFSVSIKALVLFASLMAIRLIFKKIHPIFIIVIAAATGVVFSF